MTLYCTRTRAAVREDCQQRASVNVRIIWTTYDIVFFTAAKLGSCSFIPGLAGINFESNLTAMYVEELREN